MSASGRPTGNRLLDEPATPETCAADRGTPAQRAERNAEADLQRGQAQVSGNVAGKSWRGHKSP